MRAYLQQPCKREESQIRGARHRPAERQGREPSETGRRRADEQDRDRGLGHTDMPRDDVAQGAGERRAERQKDEPVESFAGWPGDDQNACESDTDREPASPSDLRSEEHTSELQSLMRISSAVFCLKKKKNKR